MVAPQRPAGVTHRLVRLALAAMALVLLAPSGQSWTYMSNGPVHADADVNYDVETDPDNPEASAGATVLVCSGRESGYRLDFETDPGWITVWVPLGPDGSGLGTSRTTAGCGDDGSKEAPVELVVWVDDHPWGLY